MGFVECRLIQPGDLLKVKRKIGYSHYGIAVSYNEVIHFSGTDSDSILDQKSVCIIKTFLDVFLKGDICEIMEPYDSPFSREEVVNRAYQYLGQNTFMGKSYNLLSNNCEHFARYIYYGKKDSAQVDVVVGAVTSAIVAGATTVAAAVTKKIASSKNAKSTTTKNEIIKK